ncbi:MAG: tetratricopeptide repeat protein [Bacteroidia bacterium]
MWRTGLWILIFFLPLRVLADKDKDSLLVYLSSVGEENYVSSAISLSKQYLFTDPAKSVELAVLAHNFALEHKREADLSHALVCMGSSYFHLGIYDSSLKYFSLGLEKTNPETDKDRYVDILSSLGACFHRKEDFAQAIDLYTQALAYNPGAKVSGKIFHNIAVVYSVQSELEKAQVYCEKALESFEAEKDTTLMVSCINNLGNILFNQKKYDLALEAFQRGLQLSIVSSDDRQKVMILNNIGEIYKAEGDLVRAEAEFRKAIKVNEQVGIIRLEAASYSNLAEVLAMTQREKEAIKYYQHSLDLAHQYHFLDIAADNHEDMATLYKKMGLFREATQALEEYIVLKDSIDSRRNDETVLKLKDKFESQVKETEILRQNSEIQRLTLQRKNIVLAALIIGLLVIAFMSAIVYNRYKESRKLNASLQERNAFIQQQNIEIEEKNRKMEYSNQELQQFAYIVSHDLREPLRTIANYSTLFAHRYQSLVDDEGRTYLDTTVSGVKQMQNLLDQLLSYVVIQTRAYEPVTVDCRQVLSLVRQSLADEINESGAVISEENLPVIQSSQVLIGILFKHLISNAIRFRRPDTPPLIHITASRERDYFRFSFRDNGVGMDASHLSKIFSIFYQVNSANDPDHTGIGLAICQKIVRLHKGEISAESRPGEGTTIRFTLSNLRHEVDYPASKFVWNG